MDLTEAYRKDGEKRMSKIGLVVGLSSSSLDILFVCLFF